MKVSILAVVLGSLMAVSALAGPTILTYIIEHEIDQPDTYVELSLKVEA